MSGTRGNSQQFGIRLAIEGADVVEAGLRRVQDSAAQTATAVERTGDSTGRALAVIERGTQAASQGLSRMGGDFAALAPIVDNAGGAVGRLVTSLGSGAGLLGVMGALGAAVTAAVALYQNWETVTRAVGGAIDILTGRVRLNQTAINDANGALRAYLQLSETALQAANRAFIQGQRQTADAARDRIPGLEQNERELAAALERAREGGGTGRIIARGGASGLVPTDEFGRAADQAVQDRIVQQRQQEIARLEGDLARVQAAIRGQQRIVSETEGRIAGAVADQSNSNPGRPPADPTPPTAPGGGGGGRPDLLPTPPQFIEYEQAAKSAADTTSDFAEKIVGLDQASRQAGKAIAGAFEDAIFAGKGLDDVLKNLERTLLSIGTRVLIGQPFEQAIGQLVNVLGGGKNTPTSGLGGLIGQASSWFSGVGPTASTAVDLGSKAFAAASFATLHTGGVAGLNGTPRLVPLEAFAGAPRYHSGTMGAGMIGPDEVPAILRRGETVRTVEQEAALSKRMGGNVTVVFNGVTDAASFRNSEAQITGKLVNAIGRSRRNR